MDCTPDVLDDNYWIVKGTYYAFAAVAPLFSPYDCTEVKAKCWTFEKSNRDVGLSNDLRQSLPRCIGISKLHLKLGEAKRRTLFHFLGGVDFEFNTEIANDGLLLARVHSPNIASYSTKSRVLRGDQCLYRSDRHWKEIVDPSLN